MKRPLSVTIICWLILLVGAIGLVTHLGSLLVSPHMKVMGQPLQQRLPLGVSVEQMRQLAVFDVVFDVVGIFSAIMLFMRQGWARWLYLIAWVAILVITFIMAPSMLYGVVFSLIALIVFAIFLFRPTANAYFKGKVPKTGE